MLARLLIQVLILAVVSFALLAIAAGRDRGE